jgi:hypothetical protein
MKKKTSNTVGFVSFVQLFGTVIARERGIIPFLETYHPNPGFT